MSIAKYWRSNRTIQTFDNKKKQLGSTFMFLRCLLLLIRLFFVGRTNRCTKLFSVRNNCDWGRSTDHPVPSIWLIRICQNSFTVKCSVYWKIYHVNSFSNNISYSQGVRIILTSNIYVSSFDSNMTKFYYATIFVRIFYSVFDRHIDESYGKARNNNIKYGSFRTQQTCLKCSVLQNTPILHKNSKLLAWLMCSVWCTFCMFFFLHANRFPVYQIQIEYDSRVEEMHRGKVNIMQNGTDKL